jgi:folate-binding protein YgfZ
VSAVTDTHADELRALREGVGLVDRAGRGRLALTGAEAKEFLQGQLSNDIEALEPGHGCYAALLTPKGKMLGDLRVLDVGDELLLGCERVALQPLFNMIRRFKLGRDVEVHKRTVEMGELSLIGPAARELAGAGELGSAEHDSARGEIGGHPVLLVATDAGVDAFCDAERTEGVRGALLAAGAVEASEAAAEVDRVERGRPREGRALNHSVIPQEAGLNERAVSFTKGCYVGQETVARLFYRGKPNRHLRGLRLSAPVEPGTPLRLGEREVGRVTSVAISPTLGPIGLALVRREASPGDVLAAGEGETTATVAELPFQA